MLIMPWKNPFLQHNPCNWLRKQVKKQSSVQANDEKPAGKGAKTIPP